MLEVRKDVAFRSPGISRLPPPALPGGALVYVFTPLTDQRILDVLHQVAGPRPTRWSSSRSPPATRTSKRATAAAELALRLWRADRDAIRFALAERGIAVISHRPGKTLDLALAPLLRTRIRGGLPMSRIDDRLARLTARFLGTALAVASCDPPAAFHRSGPATAMVVLVSPVLAWWAAPMVDERPVQTSMRWGALARRRRTTVLAAGSVVLAAWTQPPVWLAACVTVLLLAYLLATDTWTAGVTATADVPGHRGARARRGRRLRTGLPRVVRAPGAHLLGAAPRSARAWSPPRPAWRWPCGTAGRSSRSG